jgi:SRSO17 transposase
MTGTWALVDSELFLTKEWFTPAFAERRQRLGLPTDRVFATKLEQGLQMIRRARAQGLPFELVACDDSYGRSRALRAAWDAEGLAYAAEVPSNTQVYLKRPKVGRARRRHTHGRKPTRLKVVSRQRPHEVRQLARSSRLTWERVTLRPTERGELTADFAILPVWTLTETLQVRAEQLVIRRDLGGRLTFVLLNAPPDTPAAVLRERSCQRYFTERVYQDAKSETGWDDFQAQKYRAWEHAVALTAAALWFVADVKLTWRETYVRDPLLLEQFELVVLPALSTANVRDLLQAVLPVPQLTPQQARELVVKHLVNRARSTRSRLRRQHDRVGET